MSADITADPAIGATSIAFPRHEQTFPTLAHPEIELLSEHEKSLRSVMQPVYPSTETLANRGITNRVVNKMMQQLFLETQALFSETLPAYLTSELKLIPKNAALFNIHFPKSADILAKGYVVEDRPEGPRVRHV